MNNSGLTEILISRFGVGPEMHQDGTKTIDGIFARNSITVSQGGYTSHDASPGDHQWL